MRRSAVRTFERAGVPRSVAMSIVGHKTESIYRRYAIVDEAMQREPAARLDAWMAATTDPRTRDEIVAHATSDEVAPQRPHRSRLVLPVPERDADLDALVVHELTHLLVCEIILPEQSGDGGLLRWVHEGIANYMVGTWSDDHECLMRNLAASGNVPSLSQLSGSGGFADERLNDALGHAAFDYIESGGDAAAFVAS